MRKNKDEEDTGFYIIIYTKKIKRISFLATRYLAYPATSEGM